MRKVTIITCSIFIAFFFVSTSAFSAVSHKVKSGNTVKKVCKKNGISSNSNKSTNKLKSVALKPGQAITTPSETKTNAKSHSRSAKAKKHSSTTQKEAKNRVLPAQVEEMENDEYIEYKLQRGENINKVAEKFNVDFQEIIELNNISRKSIRPGTVIFIPKTQDESEDTPIVLNDKLSKPWKSEDERGILVKVAKSFAGAPYRYGGDSVRGLDCSAFVRKMYEIFSIDLPRSAREQYCAGPRVNKEDLNTGDLVFFKTKRLTKYPTHVGIFIGNDMFIHASSTLKRGVKVDHLSDTYYSKTYTGAVRLKAPPQSERSDIEPETQRNTNNS